MTEARHTHASVVIHEKILVIGGVDRNDNILNSVEHYDPGTNKWTRAASMNERRSAFQTGVINSSLYVLGGCGGNDGFSDHLMSIEKYSMHEDTWTMVGLENCLENDSTKIAFV